MFWRFLIWIKFIIVDRLVDPVAPSVAKVHSSHRPPAGPSAGRPRRRGNARQLAPVQWFQRRSGQGQRGAHVVAPLPGTQGTQGLKGTQGPHGVTTTLCIHGMKLRYGKWWWSVMHLLDFWLLKVSRFQVTCHTKVMLKRGWKSCSAFESLHILPFGPLILFAR